MGNKDRPQNKHSQGGGTLLRGLGALLVENNIWVGILPVEMVIMHVLKRSTNTKD